MADSFENDENLDVLQNIEFAIVDAARESSGADDYDVMGALDAIIKDFRDIERGREPKPHMGIHLTPPPTRYSDQKNTVKLSILACYSIGYHI